jgi:hypothetical protein
MADRRTTSVSFTSVPWRGLLGLIALTVIVGLVGWWTARGTVQYAEVSVRWRPGVRARVVASRLSLHAPEQEPLGMQKYMLTDTTPTNIAAILASPAIDRVERIDRATLVASEWSSGTPANWLVRRYPWLDRRFGSNLQRLIRPVALAPCFLFASLIALAGSRRGRSWLVARVPALTPDALAAFRIVFALSVSFVVLGSVHVSWLRALCLGLLAAFAAGVAPRWMFASFVVAFTFVLGRSIDGHADAQPVRTLWLMMLVPWDAGPRLDLRRGRIVQAPTADARRWYGLAVWIPMFMIGIAYLAAAFAKFDESGIAWATHGGIRYFLVEEAANAPGRLGRLVASSDTLSILFSSGALATECAVIVAAFWPNPWVRLVLGLAALSLHLGFYLLQGIWWSFWWMLLPAFLPWEWLSKPRTAALPSHPGSLPVYAGLILLLVALQQSLISLVRVDYAPWFSDFPMYADVQWESKDAYATFANEVRQPPPQILLAPDDGSSSEVLSARLKAIGGMEPVLDVARSVTAGKTISDEDARKLRAAAGDYTARFGLSPPRIIAVTHQWNFDWSKADFSLRTDAQRLIVDLASGVAVRAGGKD